MARDPLFLLRRTSPFGLTTVEWPQALYEAESLRAGEHAATKSWLSTARPRSRSSQCSGPVVVLKAPAQGHSQCA